MPLPIAPEEEDPPPEVILLMKHLAESPVTFRDIRIGTQQYPVLSSVLRNVRLGWPKSPDSALLPFIPAITSFRYKTDVYFGEAESLYHPRVTSKFSMSYMKLTLAFPV